MMMRGYPHPTYYNPQSSSQGNAQAFHNPRSMVYPSNNNGNNNRVMMQHPVPGNPITNQTMFTSRMISQTGILGCTCKKSKCLKLYCQCFSSQAMCGSDCNCSDCHNTSQAEHLKERQMALEHVLVRNPNAFKQINSKNKGSTSSFSLSNISDGGCNCRKSFCLKKYCECFNSGKKCDEGICGCVNCHNRAPQQQARDAKPSSDAPSGTFAVPLPHVPMSVIRTGAFLPVIRAEEIQSQNIPGTSRDGTLEGSNATKRKREDSVSTAAAALIELCTNLPPKPLPTSTLVSIGSTCTNSTIDSAQSFDTLEAHILGENCRGMSDRKGESRNPSPTDYRNQMVKNNADSNSAFLNLVIAATSSKDNEPIAKKYKIGPLPKELSFRKICSKCGKTRSEHGELGFGTQKCIFEECGRCGAGIECHRRNNMPMGFKCKLTVDQGAFPGASEKYESKINHMCEDYRRESGSFISKDISKSVIPIEFYNGNFCASN